MGIYAQVLLAIGVDKALARIAEDDELGRTLPTGDSTRFSTWYPAGASWPEASAFRAEK